MGRRGRRTLTPEERALWDRVRATAIPIRPAPAVADTPPDPPPPPRPPVPPQLQPPTPPAKPARTPAPAAPQLDRRRFDKLRRGRLEPESRLDLHGLRADAAHAALNRFILSAHAGGLRLVLVITGKGRAPDDAIAPQRHGILHHSVPHWLTAPPLAGRVLDVVSAHQRHGGGGAYYVYLRRIR